MCVCVSMNRLGFHLEWEIGERNEEVNNLFTFSKLLVFTLLENVRFDNKYGMGELLVNNLFFLNYFV